MEQGSSSHLPVPTVAELQAKVVEALTPLAASIPSLDRFTVQSILDTNLTVGDFCSAVRPLQSFASQGILGRVIASACVCWVFSCVNDMQTRDLYQVSQWVKTAAGKKAIANITATPMLEKRARHAWVSIFTTMQAEHAALAEREKRKFKRKRAELRKQLEAVDMEEAADLAKFLVSMYPALANFAPIDKQALTAGSWNAYVNDCHLKGILAKPRVDQFLVQAINEYGAGVRDAHIENYCQQPQVQQLLDEFARKKTFRRYLAAATEKQIAVPAFTTAETTPPERAQPTGRTTKVDAAVRTFLWTESAGEESDGAASV